MARQGVEEAVTYLEEAGGTVSEEHSDAALEGSIDAADDLEERDDVNVNPTHMRQSAYGAAIGALQQISTDSVVQTPGAERTTIDPSVTYEIVLGSRKGSPGGTVGIYRPITSLRALIAGFSGDLVRLRTNDRTSIFTPFRNSIRLSIDKRKTASPEIVSGARPEVFFRLLGDEWR